MRIGGKDNGGVRLRYSLRAGGDGIVNYGREGNEVNGV